jgi:hypothetical protein
MNSPSRPEPGHVYVWCRTCDARWRDDEDCSCICVRDEPYEDWYVGPWWRCWLARLRDSLHRVSQERNNPR